MRIYTLKAKRSHDEYKVFVSERCINRYCDDCRSHEGWWWCIEGATMAHFTDVRPRSGCQLNNCPDLDVFGTLEPISTTQEFSEHVTDVTEYKNSTTK